MHLSLATSARYAGPDGRVVELAPRDAALLAYLALEGPTARLKIVELLWPDSTRDDGLNVLRQRLFQLRKHLGVAVVEGQATLALVADVSHDLSDSVHVLGDTVHEHSREFATWLSSERTRRANRAQRALAESCEAAERAGDYGTALTYALDLLALEPFSESAHRRVMRMHYLNGDRSAALLAFDRCEQMLKDEVGGRPSAETLALLATITASGPAAAPVLSHAIPVSVLMPPRMIGRDLELAQLHRGWHDGQVVAVIGEAGLGKTRLLQSFLDAHPGAVRAAGRPGDSGVPFATLARLLRAVIAREATPVGFDGSLSPATRNEIARVLPEFEATPVSRQPGEGQRLVMQRAIRALLAAQRNLSGLVVDDLHFADEASLEMLRSLIDEEGYDGTIATPPLRWVLAYRPAEAGSPVQALHDAMVEDARLLPIVLAPLDEAALAELVTSLALPGVDGGALARGLARRTGGNPLFVLETLKQAWVERRLSQVADAGALPRPMSVGRIIERRVSQLSPEALALARVASIAGADFSVAMAERVLQASAMQFADALNELEAAQVMRGNAFAHDLVFEAVRASVPATIAAHTHASVAAFLESVGTEPARIAQHWIDAGQPQRALPWLQQAADRARRGLRVKESIAFMERKSAIEEASGDNSAAFVSLLRAAEDFNNVDRDRAMSLAKCDALDRLASNPTQRIEALLHRSFFEKDCVSASDSVDSARKALQESVLLADAELIARSHRALATSLFFADRLAESAQHYEASMGWLDAHGTLEDRAEMHGYLGILYDNLGRLGAALPHHERALELSQEGGKHDSAAVVFANLACNRIDAGDIAAAHGHLQRSLQIMALHDGYEAGRGTNYAMLVVCSCQAGRYTEALAQAEQAIELMKEHASSYASIALLRQAMCWRHLGQWARVQKVLDADSVRASVHDLCRSSAAVLQHYLDLARGHDPGAALADMLASLVVGERPDLRLPLLIEHAQTLPVEAGLKQLDLVCVEAGALQHEGTVFAAHVRAAGMAAAADPVVAARHAYAALQLADHRQSSTLLPAECWLHCGRALLAAGERDRAATLLAEGSAWLQRTAREHVPETFRASFLQRNPVNRELLSLAAKVHR